MIRQLGMLFCLETLHTSYLFAVNEAGLLQHLYYGEKLDISAGTAPLFPQQEFIPGNAVAYDVKYPSVGLETMLLEAGARGKGDIREPFVDVTFADGSNSLDLLYETCGIYPGKYCLEGLPCSYDDEDDAQTLSIVLKDRDTELRLELLYSVFEKNDVITRSARILNRTEETITVNRLMSAQLDFDEQDLVFTTFYGAWAREMNRQDRPCGPGILASGTMAGTSSNRSNPFCMLSEPHTTEDRGLCIGLNLVYSGNHLELCEGNAYGGLRLLNGIHPEGFTWTLAPGESLVAPEAVMTLSMDGFNGMSRQMHAFVRKHIVRGEWRDKPRPVLLNSWESSYFHFNEASLLKLARKAKEVGVELFVMDDGWFGKRDDDTTSLGDWTVYQKKLPGGLNGLADKIKKLGLDFGIWVEPEMVNEDSELYRAHPEWVIRHPNRHHSVGRNQMILNLALPEVVDYLYHALEKVFSSAEISYVKWDMNRIFSDAYGQGMPVSQQPELFHRYQLGLYQLLDRLTKRFPKILFEACASGGNRFDLGMLCYMPQIWTSDDTDAQCRTVIQNGTSYGYPISVMSAHVSAVPNHQSLRTTPMYSRFTVASFGLLGYECNLNDMNREDREAIRAQIALYKEWRDQMQFGEFYRLPADRNHTRWMIVSQDKKKAWLLNYHTLLEVNSGVEVIRTRGLDDESAYQMSVISTQFNLVEFGGLINHISPVHIKAGSLAHQLLGKLKPMDMEKESMSASGNVFNRAGFRPKQVFGGTGFSGDTRYMPDFGSRIYVFEMTESDEDEAMEVRDDAADVREGAANDGNGIEEM
ncbi:MAG: alpha-galactosidase [Lachnospiraceae bacterium]|nr:alpha-galactosidase [Lachnospiraceae bacterium]